MLVSVLIPFREGDPVRRRNLDWITGRLKALHPEWEVIIEYEPLDQPSFQKARGLNLAFARSTGDVVIQMDAEIFALPEHLEESVRLAEQHGWCLVRRIYKLEPEMSQAICEGPVDAEPPAEGSVETWRKDGPGRWGWGYSVAVRRDKWLPFDERFVGWGHEDVAWSHAMRTLVGEPAWQEGAMYHLWHPTTAQDESKRTGSLHANQRLVRSYKAALGRPALMKQVMAAGAALRRRETPGWQVAGPLGQPAQVARRPGRAPGWQAGAAQAQAQREQLARYLEWVKAEGGQEGPTHLATMLSDGQQERLCWLRAESAGTIMELGCNWGYVLAYVRGHIGVDWNQHSIELARILNPSLEFRCEDVRELSAGDRSVDTVILPDILEHLAWEDVPGVVRAAQRVARQRVLITLPAPDSRYATSPKHRWLATGDKVEALIAECGGRAGKAGDFVTILWQRGGAYAQPQLPVTFYADKPNYVDHLAPIYSAMNGHATFEVSTPALQYYCAEQGIEARVRRPVRGRSPGVLVLATVYSPGTMRAFGLGKKLVLINHGSGQGWVGNPHSSYAGGPRRGHFSLILEPGEEPAERDRQACPKSRVVAIGCPKLDRWAGYEKPADITQQVIAIGFHMPTMVCPESRGAFAHYKAGLPAVVAWCREQGHEVLGAGHPTMWDTLQPFWEGLGVEPVPDWDDVMERATLYVRDQCSTLYEFASLDKPVVVLNAPWYRRDVEHGLRFWTTADVGVQCDSPEGLIPAIEAALADPPEQQEKRRAAVRRTYAYLDGRATERAVEEILRLGG